MDEDTPTAEEEEVEPTPPHSTGRRSKAPITTSKKKSTPVAKASAKVTKQKANSPLDSKTVAAPSSPAMPKRLAKTPLVARSAAKGRKSKGKTKAKDVYDVDESE